MKNLSGLETKLEEVFVKKAPFQLPQNGKKWIVQWSPWINLVLGLLTLWAAKALWDLGHTVNTLVGYLNDLSVAYGGNTASPELGVFYWVSLIVLIAEAVLMLAAVPGLMKRSKSRGWNLVFLGALANIAYGVFYLFTDQGGVGSFISSLIGSAIGLYILFQIREYYHD